MKRAAVALGLLLVVAAVWLLVRDEAAEVRREAQTAPVEAPASPGFRVEAPAPYEAPSPLVGKPGAVGAGPLAPVASEIAPPPVPVRTVSGLVVRASDREPLVDVKVRCVVPLLDVESSSRAPDGRFRLEHVAQSADELQLSGPGGKRSVAIAPGGHDLHGMELLYDTGCRVSVRALDSSGRLLPDAQFRGGFIDARDASGSVILRDVGPESPAEVTARAPFLTEEAVELPLPEDRREIPAVELRLFPAGRIEGFVTDVGGAPAANARVLVSREAGPDGTDVMGREVWCDPDGGFIVDHLAPGSWVVSAQRAKTRGSDAPADDKPSRRTTRRPPTEAELQAGGTALVPGIAVRAQAVSRVDLVLSATPGRSVHNSR